MLSCPLAGSEVMSCICIASLMVLLTASSGIRPVHCMMPKQLPA
jgi:hypothetical protein